MVRVKKYSWRRFSIDLKRGVEFLTSMSHEEATDDHIKHMIESVLKSEMRTNLIWDYGISPLYCKKLDEHGNYTGWQVLKLQGVCYLLDDKIVEIVHQDKKEYYRIGVGL